MQRFLLTLQYLGTNYAGWQRQENALSIQEVCEEALSRMCGEPIVLHAAGRTDAGVHARAQMAHCDIPIRISGYGLTRGFNQHLPNDIRVVDAQPVDPDFHARFLARGKSYTYRILNREAPDVFLLPTHTHIHRELDIELMQEALRPAVGEHDFKAFTVANPQVSETIRNLSRAELEREGDRILIHFEGDGFLRFMIRRIVGALLEAGSGKLGADAVSRSLAPRFAECRWTAPPQGLTLEQVRYESTV